MKYYLHIDSKTNEIIGRYIDSIHTNIPKPSYLVDLETWNKTVQDGYNYYNVEDGCVEKKEIIAEKTESEIIAEYKTAYLTMFNTKLVELDYDDIATVGVWAIKDGSKFQAEAKTLLNWYEAIINKNYEILNAVKSGNRDMPTKEEYLAELPQYSTHEL